VLVIVIDNDQCQLIDNWQYRRLSIIVDSQPRMWLT